MGWFRHQRYININLVTFKRFCMIAEEVHYLNYDEELTDVECRNEAESMIQKVLDEYVRQHFEESTKNAIKLALDKQPKYTL